MTMRDCADGDVRDLLPDFVHETLAEAEQARVGAHVSSCADCAAEVALLRTIGACLPAPAVDVRRIVAALPAFPGGVVRRPAFPARPWRFAAAATVLAVAGISLAVVQGTFLAAGSGRATVAAPDAVTRTRVAPVGTVGETLASVVRPVKDAAGLAFDGGLADLTDKQLQSLLGEIDALDAKPSAEPESPVGNIVPVREGEYHES